MNIVITEIKDTQDLTILARVYDDNSFDKENPSDYIVKKWAESDEINRYFIVLSMDNKPVGFAASSYVDICGGSYFLSELYTHSSFRRLGLASILVKEVIKNAIYLGYKSTTTETKKVNIPAQELYQKLGFKIIPNPETDNLTFRMNHTEFKI